MTPRIVQIDADLYYVILPVPLPGFDDFIGSFIHTGNPSFIVDVGPGACAPMLLGALAEIGLKQPDMVLLTHIHIDHAGGAGIIGRHFPRTAFVCHPKAIDHMKDPTRLWKGTLKTLGHHIARTYHPFEAVPAKSILAADQLCTSEIKAMATPGHALHHYSYLFDEKVLFAGEAMGVCLPTPGETVYLRPATPPRFFLDTYLESLERLATCHPQTVCFGHLGYRSDFGALMENHRHQMASWKQWITPWYEGAPDDLEGKMEASLERLLALDPLLAEFDCLAPEVQQRERGFLSNSIRGFWGYLADEKKP
jgi:glyoxylase-like metal-dependent hydrolase (beta-lactamase superfamily II)